MTAIKPLICGISGPFLTEEEKEFLSRINPLGFVVFKKNLFDRKQALKLTNELREVLGNRKVPILIDQEGGKVLRLREEQWRQPLAPLELGKFAYLSSTNALEKTKRLVYLNAVLTAMDMQEIGVNVNCAPVADLLYPGAHHITSSRSFGPNNFITTELVKEAASGMKTSSVQPIMKHMLGQGRANVDSHFEMPVVEASLSELEENDFKVFELAKNIDWGMPAHIVYKSLDPTQPVTYSKKIVDYIRNKIGFNGILISDCLTMKALPETWGQKAAKSVKAGLDLVLYGSCNHTVIQEIVNAIPELSESIWEKVENSFSNLEKPTNLNYQDLLQEFDELLIELESSLAKQKKSKDLQYILAVLQSRNLSDADYSSPLYKA